MHQPPHRSLRHFYREPHLSVIDIPADLARRLTYMLIDSEYVGTYEATVSTNTGSE
ncbi:MAG: hypothetical protein IKQ89_05340 [Muribaculaceae bacterium]|nr:hypothetical protein [Muribaculaceae bacterium]